MKVLVTGATGFLGSNLIEQLMNEGVETHTQGRNSKIAEGLHSTKFWRGDLSNREFVSTLPRDFTHVVHCAALSSPWGRAKDFYSCNVVATRNLIQHLRGSSALKRFVNISSPSLYVDTQDRFLIREDEPLPRIELNDYISTKKQAEHEVDLAVADGFPALTLRPQGIVGRGDRAIFPRIMRTARRGFVPRIGHGQTQMDLTHVDNVVEAILLAMRAPAELHGRKYNITNDEPVLLYPTIAELMRRLKVEFRWKDLSFKKAFYVAHGMEMASRHLFRHKEPLLTRYSVCVLGVSRTLSLDAAKKDLGYRPRVKMEQAMESIVESMMDAPL